MLLEINPSYTKIGMSAVIYRWIYERMQQRTIIFKDALGSESLLLHGLPKGSPLSFKLPQVLNHVFFNPGQCKVLMHRSPIKISLRLNGSISPVVEEVKFLGIIFNALPILVHLTRDQDNLLETSYRYTVKSTLGLPAPSPNAVIYELSGYTPQCQ